MPKVKTNSGAKKRFALTGTGKIKRKHARRKSKRETCVRWVWFIAQT